MPVEAPITYPSRIWNGKEFEPNLDRAISSDQVTTVAVKDTNEVVGFPDGTDIHAMQNAINGDLHGTISEHKPSFYENNIQGPLSKLGMDMFQPKFITDIKPTPERAFATQFAAGASADILKFPQQDKEALANPAQAFAGRLAGTVAGYATLIMPAMESLGLVKVGAELPAFVGNIAKQGLAGGIYRGISDTANQLRDEDHPDLAKIGSGVLHDTLWWGAIGGITGAASKPVGMAASAGLGYLMAKSDGASEPDALLNGGILAGFHLISAHGDKPEVRQAVADHTEKMVADYVQAKNPIIDEHVALQTGREMVADYADKVLEDNGMEPSSDSVKEVLKDQELSKQLIQNIGEEVGGPRAIAKQQPSFLEEAKARMSEIEDMSQMWEAGGTLIEGNQDNGRKIRTPSTFPKELSDIGLTHRHLKTVFEAFKSGKPLTNKQIGTIQKLLNWHIKARPDMGGENAKSTGTETQQGSEQTQGVEQGTESSVRVRDNAKNGMETKAGTKVEYPNLTEVKGSTEGKIAKASRDINTESVKKGFDELSPEEQAQFNPISKKEQLQKVSDLLSAEPERAKNMASGNENIPEDIHKQTLFNAVKNKAIEEGDIETIRNLALSPLAKERSLAAQTLAAASFDNGVTHDPVKIIQEVQKAIGKENAFPKETKEIVKKFKDAIKESAPKQSDWEKFIEDLKC